MSAEHEEAVRAFLLAADGGGERWESTQVAPILSRMAPDARYHVFAWQEPYVGHDAIRQELLREAPSFRDGQVEFLNFASVGKTVFVERIDWVTMQDKRCGFHVVGVFDLDDNGKIVSWRDYLDSAEITAAVGREGWDAGR